MENPILSTQALKYQYKSNRNKFNGKETQDKGFSDGSGLAFDDNGVRMYDPQLGRLMVSDLLTENSRRFSSYVYCFNNPLGYKDPNGGNADRGQGQPNISQLLKDPGSGGWSFKS